MYYLYIIFATRYVVITHNGEIFGTGQGLTKIVSFMACCCHLLMTSDVDMADGDVTAVRE